MSDFSFRQFLAEAVVSLDQAMAMFGLKPGQTLTSDEFNKIWRPIATKQHPDVNPEGAADFNKTIEAVDAIKHYLHNGIITLPQSGYDPSSTLKSQGGTWDDLFKRTRQERPPEAKTVTDEEVRQFCQELLDKGRRQVIYRSAYQGFEVEPRIGRGPYGSQQNTKQMHVDTTADELHNDIKDRMPEYPSSIIDIHHGGYDSWITFMDHTGFRGSHMSKYKSISFQVPKPAAVKVEGSLSRPAVERILESQGLKKAGKSSDSYYNFTGVKGEDYYILCKAKKISVIKRASFDRGYKKEWFDTVLRAQGKTKVFPMEFFYGKVTEPIVNSMINFLKRRIAQHNNTNVAEE